MPIDVLVWEGLNEDRDHVTVWRSASGDFPIAFRNNAEGYAGSTILPKEALDKMTDAPGSPEATNRENDANPVSSTELTSKEEE